MTLIPADMLGQMQEMATLSHMSALDSDVNRILQDKYLSTDVKFKHYQDALQRYQMGSQPRAMPPLPPPAATHPVEAVNNFPKQQLLANIPKQKQRSAKMLADFIENIPDLSLTAKNELRINNETIPNSNIVDLFGDLTRDHQADPVPRGYEQFTELLNAYNVPLEAIGNRKRRESIAQIAMPVAVEADRKRQSSKSNKRQPALEEMPALRKKEEAVRRRRMQPVVIDEELEGTPRKSNRLQQQSGSKKNYAKINRGTQQWKGV